MSAQTHETDLAIIGLGAVGAFAFRDAAQRGIHALGIEQFDEIGHEFGASGGQTRIFRLAYKEGSAYLPLLQESLECWEDMRTRVDGPVWEQCGALMIGSPDHPEMRVFEQSIRDFQLNVDRVSQHESAERWPLHSLFPDDIVYFDPSGGLLRPGTAIRTAVADGEAAGGQVLTGTRIASVVQDGRGGYRLETDFGTRVQAHRLLVASGPWVKELAPETAQEVVLRTATLHWFPVDEPGRSGTKSFPVGMRRSSRGFDLSFFPAVDAKGIKVNLHAAEKHRVSSMAETPASVPDEYSGRVAAIIPTVFKGVSPAWSDAKTFVDAYTADKRPVFGRPDHDPHALIVTGLSGQGFKMVPAIARQAIDLLDGVGVASLTKLPIRLV